MDSESSTSQLPSSQPRYPPSTSNTATARLEKFETVFRSTYSDPSAHAVSRPAYTNAELRLRRTSGAVLYVCVSPGCKWSNGGRGNCVKHARLHGTTIVNPKRLPSRRIASTASSTASTPNILGYMVPRGEEATLRRAFNHQRYIEALISLFTVHRLPFSAIEYGAIKEFALACNPNIEDMLRRGSHGFWRSGALSLHGAH